VQAELAELADALDSGSSAARLPGSSPGFRISILNFRLPILVKQRVLGHTSQLNLEVTSRKEINFFANSLSHLKDD
jgi:hypothetical protein